MKGVLEMLKKELKLFAVILLSILVITGCTKKTNLEIGTYKSVGRVFRTAISSESLEDQTIELELSDKELKITVGEETKTYAFKYLDQSTSKSELEEYFYNGDEFTNIKIDDFDKATLLGQDDSDVYRIYKINDKLYLFESHPDSKQNIYLWDIYKIEKQ